MAQTKLSSFFNPRSVAVVGVSENPKKLGSIIFQNILDSGFSGKLYGVNPKYDGEMLYGKPCVGSMIVAPQPIDLVVIVIPGKFTEAVVDECISNHTKNIIIISAGFGEVGEHVLEEVIASKCAAHNINLLGPNCLGAIFPHADLNASFSQGYPKKGNVAFVSQSGAFCTAMLDWAAQKEIGFSHFVSLGNKAGIDEIQLVESFLADDTVDVIALYLESLRNGEVFLELLKKVTPTKPVVILEPGKSKAAQAASASHTGSLSPNARVLQYAYQTAGVVQVFSMRDMFSTLETLVFYAGREFGKRVAIVTNAGGAGVLSSDLVEDHNLELAELSDSTQKALSEHLPAEANVKNPIDIIGDADAQRYEDALRITLEDPNVDQVLVLLTPQRTTEVGKTASIIAQHAAACNKPIMASFIGGKETSKGFPILEKNNVPAFQFPNDALSVMGMLAHKKDRLEALKNKKVLKSQRNADIVAEIEKEQPLGGAMLSEELTKRIASKYNCTLPLSGVFDVYKEGLNLAKKVFPRPVVLKISSPNAVHKSDLKGVFLNISDEPAFKDAWEHLQASIKIAKIHDASIAVQEQVEGSTEAIVGIHTDANFGKVLLFGSGGIYTELMADTSLRILPTKNIEGLILETKVGKILQGLRGQKPKALKKLALAIEALQQIALDYPEIQSIDANPVLVTEEEAYCVDLKFLV